MSKIEFDLPEWEYGAFQCDGGEFLIYNRDAPTQWVQSDTTLPVQQ